MARLDAFGFARKLQQRIALLRDQAQRIVPFASLEGLPAWVTGLPEVLLSFEFPGVNAVGLPLAVLEVAQVLVDGEFYAK